MDLDTLLEGACPFQDDKTKEQVLIDYSDSYEPTASLAQPAHISVQLLWISDADFVSIPPSVSLECPPTVLLQRKPFSFGQLPQ